MVDFGPFGTFRKNNNNKKTCPSRKWVRKFQEGQIEQGRRPPSWIYSRIIAFSRVICRRGAARLWGYFGHTTSSWPTNPRWLPPASQKFIFSSKQATFLSKSTFPENLTTRIQIMRLFWSYNLIGQLVWDTRLLPSLILDFGTMCVWQLKSFP